jgi:hypothetical protein
LPSSGCFCSTVAAFAASVWLATPQIAQKDRVGDRRGRAGEGLQALGWTIGRNVRIDYRWVTGDIDCVSLAKEIVEQQPDVILVESTAAVAALSRVSSTIPIVFVNVGDPVGGGFVASLARPGGTLPVQAPTKFSLVVNLKTAKTLGVDALLAVATHGRTTDWLQHINLPLPFD